METKEKIRQASKIIKEAEAIYITAGAGMGVDSGLPDFRGNSGFWKAYPPIAKLGISFEEMANPRFFTSNPRLAWAFYGHRLNLYRETIPHEGFNILLELGRQKRHGYFVFTSNVDGQFQKAGFDDDFIEECHGSIHHFQCTEPCTNDIWSAKNEEVDVDLEKFEAKGNMPTCSKCNEVSRPNILMFGDWSWISERSSKQYSRKHIWLENILHNKIRLAVIEMGAGSSLPTVRNQSERVASHENASLIRINPREYDVPVGAIGLPLTAKEAVRLICAKL